MSMADQESRPARSPGQSPLEAATDRAAHAAIFEARGRHAEAREALGQALAMFTDVLGADHYEVGVTLERLAGVVAAVGAQDEAGALYARALPIYERTLGRFHPRTAACRANRDKALAVPHP